MEYLKIWRNVDGKYIAVARGESRETNTFEDLTYYVLEMLQSKANRDSPLELDLKGKLVDRSKYDFRQQEKEADFTLGQQGILEMVVKMQKKIGSIAEILND